MYNMDAVTILFAHLSMLLNIVILYVTLSKGQRSHVRTAFILVIISTFIWNAGTLLDIYYRLAFGNSSMALIDLCYVGICLSPIAVLLFGQALNQSSLSFTPAHAIFLIIPCTSIIIICTNAYHHLFFTNFSVYSAEAVYGVYYYFHSAYSYGCILAGIGYMIAFIRKNSGIFSTQSLLILIGILIPLSVNVMYSFNLIYMAFSINASSFTATLFCFAVAFYKYDFLKVAPIAIGRIVDLISDGYIVIDNRNNIITSNRAASVLLTGGAPIAQSISLENFTDRYFNAGMYEELLALKTSATQGQATVSIEYAAPGKRYFTIEVTPVFEKRMSVGTIILLKDITQAKRDLEKIRETQETMMEREHLAFLGQLIGGITHNLRTPILSISGAVEGLTDLVTEYGESIGDEGVTEADHREIIRDMSEWLEKIKIHCAYISDVISTVKGQAVEYNRSSDNSFTLDEFLKRVDTLIKGELKKSCCTLRTQIEVDTNLEIAGDVNSLVQMFDNLIINAIDAYEGENGPIDLTLTGDAESFVFTLADYGKGMEPAVQARLFKEMITTKGKNGTGLGLYLSHSNIKGHFNGQITFVSAPGEGTTFTITIPKRAQTDAAQETMLTG